MYNLLPFFLSNSAAQLKYCIPLLAERGGVARQRRGGSAKFSPVFSSGFVLFLEAASRLVPTTVISSTSGTAATDWSSCLAGTGSCMFNQVYNSTANSQSPPFYDYLTDELYVGDDGGKFWKATGVFK